MQRYDPAAIEPKWQEIWDKTKLYEASEDDSRPKIYATPMLPYPSGSGLHVGHVRNYSIADTVARYHRQRGFNTMSNIGWDSFGLPAENYAIKTGVPPWITTQENIKGFRHQLKRLGLSYDWSREVDTSDPKYYKWTQWIFTELFKHDLAYQDESWQWWCPECKTVLANEQVVNGCCWRHEDTPVIKKRLKQWFFKITDYADRLLEATDDLGWPQHIKTMQKNWIGKSIGAELDFKVVDSDDYIKVFTTRPDTVFGATFLVLAPEHPLTEKITTPEHKEKVEQYIEQAAAKSDVERQAEGKAKTGVPTGAYAVNPASGEPVPVWIADYVLMGYGTGAIMAVPGHDHRDQEFATKHKLPIITVIEPTSGQAQGDDEHKDSVFVILLNPKKDKVAVLDWGTRQDRHGGHMLIGGGLEAGEDYKTAAQREIVEETGYKNFKFIKESDFLGGGYFYSNTKNRNMHVRGKGLLFELIDEDKKAPKLDDGEKSKFKITWQPIDKAASMFHDSVHEAMYRYLVLGETYTGEGSLVNSGPYEDLPSSEAREKIVADLAKKNLAQEKVNYKLRDWLISRQRYWGAPIPIIHCSKCGAVAVPEADLPVILPKVDDFAPTGKSTSVLALVEEWVNVTCPDCGAPAKRETDTMDGYACSSWYMHRYTDPHNDTKPWDPNKLNYWFPIDFYFGGDHAISHLLYFRFWNYFFTDQGLIADEKREPIKKLVYNGYIYAADGTKMSKSKGNVIDPLVIIDSGYGADALRLFELFIGPYDQDVAWNESGVPGTYRFLQRVWKLVEEFVEQAEGKASEVENMAEKETTLLSAVHRSAKKVTTDIERFSFNTAIASLMELVNTLNKLKLDLPISAPSRAWREALEILVALLAPFAPHISEELWSILGKDGSVHVDTWPSWEDKLLAEDIITVIVQVNGKLRAKLQVVPGTSAEEVKKLAQADANVKRHLPSKPKKVIVVADKLVNFVV